MPDYKYGAATHEAGHAYVSHSLGWVIETVEIHFSDERSRWEGTYRHTPPEVPDIINFPRLLVANAKVAIAGILAQAKYLATPVGASVSYSSNNDLAAWFSLFRDKNRTEASPGEFAALFTPEAGGPDNQIVLEGTFFGGADAKAFNSCFDRVSDVDHPSMIRDTIQLIDQPTGWAKITRLAEALLASPSSGANCHHELDNSSILSIFRNE